MHITKLALRDFRNFEALTLEDLNPGINVFAGRNAMGKTNLLEAVNYLSCARSFRGAPDAKLIRRLPAFLRSMPPIPTGGRSRSASWARESGVCA